MRKYKLISVFLSLLISMILLIGCNSKTNSTGSSSSNSSQPSDIKKDIKINVTMDVQPIISSDGKVKFNITTNLPNSTQLMITLTNKSLNYNAQDSVNVFDGKATTAQFSNLNKALSSGTYQIEIITPVANVQPESVQAKIGKSAENLTGSLMKEDSMGRYAEFTKDIAIK